MLIVSSIFDILLVRDYHVAQEKADPDENPNTVEVQHILHYTCGSGDYEFESSPYPEFSSGIVCRNEYSALMT